MFEGLWVDQIDALERLPDLVGVDGCKDAIASFRSFIRDGYCIIPGAVNVNAIDRYLFDFDQTFSLDSGLLASYGAEIKPAWELGRLRPLTKFLDVHAKIPSSACLTFSPLIKTFLECLFGEEALAFQSLHFEHGSTQAVHQDTAYVVIDEPKSLCACWIALEDVEPGSGELIYFPGSHRFPDYLYGDGRKHWNLANDGGEPHDRHLAWLYEQARDRGMQLQRFLPKKGDALIWHADLAHGGSEITKPEATRRSLVAHYCPVRCTPHYWRFIPPDRRVKGRLEGMGYISTFYYDLLAARPPK